MFCGGIFFSSIKVLRISLGPFVLASLIISFSIPGISKYFWFLKTNLPPNLSNIFLVSSASKIGNLFFFKKSTLWLLETIFSPGLTFFISDCKKSSKVFLLYSNIYFLDRDPFVSYGTFKKNKKKLCN